MSSSYQPFQAGDATGDKHWFFFSLLQKQSSGGGLIQLSFSKLQTFSQNEEGENLPNLCSLKIISFLQLQILSFILNFALD